MAHNPRDLFRDLQRNANIPFLWEHQGRILERYEDHLDDPHVALELPTGTGKTLIGLLIAEWRRRARDERVLYLCPTRQLAHQVAARAPDYGVRAHVCLAPEYDHLEDWQAGRSIAISTYSALFNYRPKFAEPQALVLDDAHAAEGYVADHWTVTVDRDEMSEAYANLVTLLDPIIDRRSASILGEDQPRPRERDFVELIPLPRWFPLRDALQEQLEDAVEGTDQYYAWDHHVRDGMAACNLLVSWQEIVLRPLSPATERQQGFAGATQRVYMSATLGSGGELERIFGVRRIKRLPVPEEWQRHSTGRRLFLLPSASLKPAEVDQLVVGAARRAGRALVLAPTKRAVADRRQALEDEGLLVLGATDVEETLEPFTSQDAAALVLANRYDGIDLPGSDCRLLILDGLPIAVNALERFLFQRLTATELLGERMRTRLTQGVGRCSRGESDWSTVIVASREAYDFCARSEVRRLLHPELQGELQFGLDESSDRTPSDFLDLMDIQWEGGDDWLEADEQIRDFRDQATLATDPAAERLEQAASAEIDFVYAMWRADYLNALERATAAVDCLAGDAAASYRAWWLYQAGTAAWMARDTFNRPELLGRARDLFGRAAATGQGVSWFAELAYGELGDDTDLDIAPDDLRAAERVHDRLRHIGFNGQGFARALKRVEADLAKTDATRFEEGLLSLGGLLGFDAEHPAGDNDPDGIWSISERLVLVWEAKTGENPDGEIGARTAQQAAGHAAWVRARHAVTDEALVLPLLVSDRERISASALVHANDVHVVRIEEIRRVAAETRAALARVRARGGQADDGTIRRLIVEELSRADLLPSALARRFMTRPLTRFPQTHKRSRR